MPDPDPVLRVRVASDLVAGLNRIEADARGAGHRWVNRSVILRRALEEYTSPLIALLDEPGRRQNARIPVPIAEVEDSTLTDAVRVRLDAVMRRRMDRIEAHAWATGRRRVNRSTMTRAAIVRLVPAGDYRLTWENGRIRA